MEAVRTFIIRNEKCFFRIVIAVIAALSLAIIALEYYSDGMLWLLFGMVLLFISLILRSGKTYIAKGKLTSTVSDPMAYFLLGVAIFCFPATVAVVPFYIGDALNKKQFIRGCVCIASGTYVVGIPQIIAHKDASRPIYRLVSWLNIDNVFDHNLSFWSLVTGREQLRFGMVAVVLTLGILAIGLFWYARAEKAEISEEAEILPGAESAEESFLLWTVWTCLLFLPYGHAEDGMVLELVLLAACRNLLRHHLYQGILFLQAAETLFMLGSAYGGYERLGYDFYQIAVGLNVLAWMIHSYRMLRVPIKGMY